MVTIRSSPDTGEKLKILSQDARYDLACSCATGKDEHRRRSDDDKWIYPVALPQGGYTYLFKTLLSNECVNNCKYCPIRAGRDYRRCTLSAEETAAVFFNYLKSGRVSGLFLSSGVIRNPDETMGRINSVARIIRGMNFRGYMHLKVIPGASLEAIRETVSLASAVSINIEVPGENNFRRVCPSKNYLKDVLLPLKFISRLTSPGSRYSGVKQTTQFVVGASGETDREIVLSSWDLYRQLGLNRVYFSAYQRGSGDPGLPGESSLLTNAEMLTREHRLYQVDWMLRRYGFKADEIVFEQGENLSLSKDPKESWAEEHPDFFPLDINTADKFQLLRVPGLGPVTVEDILRSRGQGRRIRVIEDLGKTGRRLNKARRYMKF